MRLGNSLLEDYARINRVLMLLVKVVDFCSSLSSPAIAAALTEKKSLGQVIHPGLVQ